MTQIYFHGLPLDRAGAYGDADVEALIGMLNDSSMVDYHENIALTLGMIGKRRAVATLISYLAKGTESGSMSRAA